MSKVQISELQATIKELQKIGAFSDEELQFLLEMDRSVEEISSEMTPTLTTISFRNHSTNPDPVLKGGFVSLLAHLKGETTCPPQEIFYLPTGLSLTHPPTVSLAVKNTPQNLSAGIVVLDHYIHDGELYVMGINYSKYPVHIKNGHHLGDLFFLYQMAPESFEWKKN
jgi:hypothetical protein